jgi:hypothetical protein
METIKEGQKGVYLFIACYNMESKRTQAFIAVTKAMLFDSVAIELENLGDHAILFTSTLPMNEIKERLKSTKAHYLLIDLTISYDLEAISGFLPESKINLIKNINKGLFSKEKISLENKMETAVENENYELAAKTRDSLTVKSSKPITPEFIENNLEYIIHPAVLQAVNELLKENYRPGKSVTFTVKKVVNKAMSICPEITSEEILEKRWLDFESIFRNAGWKVKYDSPAWDENYEQYFEFSK